MLFIVKIPFIWCLVTARKKQKFMDKIEENRRWYKNINGNSSCSSCVSFGRGVNLICDGLCPLSMESSQSLRCLEKSRHLKSCLFLLYIEKDKMKKINSTFTVKGKCAISLTQTKYNKYTPKQLIFLLLFLTILRILRYIK